MLVQGNNLLGQIATLAVGRDNDLLSTQTHGTWYNAASRGRVFHGSALIAGVTIPVNTATAATFTLHNPLGSNVNVELISLDIGWPAAAASVIATILGSVGNQTPSATTQGGVTIAMPIGAAGTGAAQAKLYTVATIVAITSHLPLLQVTTTGDAMTASHYEFDGKLVLSPGGIITLTSTPVQTAVAIPSFSWAEWPI